MKNRILATLSSLTLLTAAAAFAQSGAVMQFDVPFEFRVGTTILPAGHYHVGEAGGHVLSIRCFACKAGAMIQTEGVEARKMPETGKLVFNRYNQTYFLSSVWTPGESQGRQLHKSAAERELALNGSPATPVQVVLARR